MHRSGTSLVSSLLQRAGIHIGEKLIAANSANPRGYFEDVGFYEFHEYLLHQRGQTYLHVDSNLSFEPTGPERERARQLIAERSHRPLWGWKDPRTALFLAFWNQLLPEGRFVFVYRHPIEVLLSLLRRGEFDSHPSLMTGLDAWYIYNTKIHAFCHQHPDRCLLVHIDGVVKQAGRFAQLLPEKLRLDSGVDSETFDEIYHVNELQRTSLSPELNATLARLYPGMLELYQQLNLRADLPSNEIQADSAPSPPLSSLAHFTESLDEPISLPVKHSLLQLLLSLLAPELTERMLVRFNHSAKGTQQKVDQLWLQVQQLQRLSNEQGQELDRQSARIESLVAELSSTHDTRIWKLMQSYRSLKDRWKKAA
jgi:Sulfotransferase family